MRNQKKKGLIEFPDKKTFSLTAAGIAAAPKIPAPSTQDELTILIKEIFQITGGTVAKAYDFLLDGESHSLEAIAKECGYDPNDKKRMTSFKVMVRTLVAKEVVVSEGKDVYRMASMCLFRS
jgi:hypothetical protein